MNTLHSFDEFFNWTMTYRLDSDLPDPPGRFVRSENVQPIDREHHRQIGTKHDAHLAHFVQHDKGLVVRFEFYVKGTSR